jgi:transposase-like protein
MLKVSNLNKKHEYRTHWPMEKKIEAITQYLAVGNMRIVSAVTGVDYALLRAWKGQPWWKEYEFEIRNAKRSDTNSKLSKIIDKSLAIVEDRLENGEIILNNKTGELIRKPVTLKDTLKVTTDLFNQQAAFEKQKIDESALQQQDSIQDTLKQLAEEFAKFNIKSKPQYIEVQDVEFKETEDALPETLQEMQPDEVTGLFPTENPQEGW